MRININKKIVLSIIMIISIIFMSNISKAALEVKAKDGYGISASNAYQLCFDLKNADSTLGTNQVDPHLMLNKDWAAALFLSISTYGNEKEVNSMSININNISYCTSNGNYTGVMISKRNATSSIFSTKTSVGSVYTNIFNNKDTKYVEIINQNSPNKGLGIYDGGGKITNNGYGGIGISKQPYFWYNCSYELGGTGEYSSAFRPAIWNIDR